MGYYQIPSSDNVKRAVVQLAFPIDAWQQSIEATMQDIPLEEAAKDKKELRAALQKWGVLERPEVHWFRASPKYYPKPLSFD